VPRLAAPPEPPADLASGPDAIREELDVPGEFPADALREAEEAAEAPLPPRDDRPEGAASLLPEQDRLAVLWSFELEPDGERASLAVGRTLVLARRVGERFPAMVIDCMGRDAVEIQLADPAVRARCDGDGLEPGQELVVCLKEADPARRLVHFAPAG
jgi:hypothetical protein